MSRLLVLALLCGGGGSGRSVADRDGADFPSWSDAQAFYESRGGPERDGHRLDADLDGVACEALR